jgi:signal transduction histidine kinase/ActR/RegA family two-component response regulator
MSTREDGRSDKHGLALDVLDCLLEGCQVIGFDWTYLYMNDAAAAHGQREKSQLVGRKMTECYPGIDATPLFGQLRRCMETRIADRLENEFEFPDGSKRSFELRIEPVPHGICVLSLDMTEARRAEAALARSQEQLRHAQKMEAVGRLAGGIAHDFNNLLSVIMSYAEVIKSELVSDEPLHVEIDEISTAARRGAELTKQLLAFSRQQVLNPRVLNLNQVLGGIENMLRRLLGAGIELTTLPGAGLRNVRGDAGQIELVVMNLAVNARDAMPSGGKLTIETANVELDDDYARAHHGVSAGAYVMLAITDNGTGMDKQTQTRIFEPFFTTKEKGKGTGLGLATVFGIVGQSDGHIWVYSEPGQGTTFKVYFPVVGEAVDEVVVERPSTISVRGTETVLLVEDDDQLRALAHTVLRRAGYVVFDAANAGEALLICEQHPSRIHLMVTDLVLPRMSGRQLAERVAPLRPDMKVLFMSGYTDDAVLHHGLLDSDLAYLEKPITPTSLTRKIREVLGAAHSK